MHASEGLLLLLVSRRHEPMDAQGKGARVRSQLRMCLVMWQVDFYILQRGLVQDGLFAFERNAPKDMLFLGPSQDLWVLVR